MGWLGKLFSTLGLKKKEALILVTGLDNSGKSALLNQLKKEYGKSCRDVVPIMGYDVVTFKSQNKRFVAFEIPGEGKLRPLWYHYYHGCKGIIFVIDRTDIINLEMVKDELDMLLHHPAIVSKRIPILFLANKTDLKNGMSIPKIASSLHFEKIQDTKPCYICTTNALNGQGVQEGIQWLTRSIIRKRV